MNKCVFLDRDGVINDEKDNDIIIRGNSPKGLLWTVEGVEVRMLDPEGAEDELILDAARACPVDAITLVDEHGDQVWP